jgi:transcriptional regulator GlxA family with amidase domain
VFIHLVFDGVADGPLGVALDIVASAERIVRRGLVPDLPYRMRDWRQRVVSIHGGPVQTSAGRAFAVDGAFDLRQVRAGDVIALPGLGAPTERLVGNLLEREDILRGAALLARAHAKGALVAASCSATFVLAQSGVLDDQQATTTWWLQAAFAKRFPQVALSIEKMVVASPGVLTAGSAFAHADLMLALLAHTQGPAVAHLVARYLVLDHRESQSRYMVLDHLRTQQPDLLRLESFLRARLKRQVTVQEMARAIGTSPRTLARMVKESLGTTPQRWMQRLRIAHARHLLESTRESVEHIATRVGYADAAAFRKIFRRELGLTPHASRQAFAAR